MRFEDKRILRAGLLKLDRAKTALDAFDFPGARTFLQGADSLFGMLASNVRLNEVSEEEEKDPHVLRP